jgi:hypothetical protein
MWYKNKDNFVNTEDYILNQLFIYNYNNTNDFNTLKMKIWTLDGGITNKDWNDGYEDKDVDNPKNHFASLNNELTFLDRYIRTQENNLEENEMNYNQLVQQRIANMNRWINTLADPPSAGIYKKDWEMSYNQRPTLLTTTQFQNLYNAFKIKRSNGELDNAYDIIDKVTNRTIDDEIKNQESVIDNYESPSQTEANIKDMAEESKADNDFNYVREMNDHYDEIFDIIESLNPGSGSAPPSATGMNVVVVNACTKRKQVVISPGHSSHQGLIVTGGGYRFIIRNPNGSPASISDPSNIDSVGVSPIKNGQVEWHFSDFKYALYYALEGTTYLVDLNIDKNSLPSIPGSELSIGTRSIERFNELNTRWKNINRLREDKIQDMGTRGILESMANANVPNLLPDHEDHYDDKVLQKKKYTRTLRERHPEFT